MSYLTDDWTGLFLAISCVCITLCMAYIKKRYDLKNNSVFVLSNIR